MASVLVQVEYPILILALAASWWASRGWGTTELPPALVRAARVVLFAGIAVAMQLALQTAMSVGGIARDGMAAWLDSSPLAGAPLAAAALAILGATMIVPAMRSARSAHGLLLGDARARSRARGGLLVLLAFAPTLLLVPHGRAAPVVGALALAGLALAGLVAIAASHAHCRAQALGRLAEEMLVLRDACAPRYGPPGTSPGADASMP